jgi:microsomal dipeptidase-like Zn-dependent dipeptidase
MRFWIGVVIGLALLVVGASQVPGAIERQMNRVVSHEPYEVSPEARALHDDLLIADLHSDTLLWGRDPLRRSKRGHMDLPRLVSGNVAVQVFAATTKSPNGQNYEENSSDSDRITALVIVQAWPPRTWNSLYERARYQAQKLAAVERAAPDRLRILRIRRDLEDLLAARASGSRMVGALLETEGAHPLEGDLGKVQGLWDAGYRMMGLHHFFDNELGGSLHGESNEGLTAFGRSVVAELERREMLIDLAHSSEAVVEDVLAMTRRPLVVSHTGMKGACDSSRNIRDELMERIAAGGGVVGIGYWDGAVCDPSPEGVARSLRYAIDRLGVDHVALGSDYDGATEVTFDTSELAVLTEALLAQGASEQEIRKVMGGNVVRLFRQLLPAD